MFYSKKYRVVTLVMLEAGNALFHRLRAVFAQAPVEVSQAQPTGQPCARPHLSPELGQHVHLSKDSLGTSPRTKLAQLRQHGAVNAFTSHGAPAFPGWGAGPLPTLCSCSSSWVLSSFPLPCRPPLQIQAHHHLPTLGEG